MPPGGNMEDILKEHDRHIQQAVRRARFDKSKVKGQLERDQSEALLFAARNGNRWFWKINNIDIQILIYWEWTTLPKNCGKKKLIFSIGFRWKLIGCKTVNCIFFCGCRWLRLFFSLSLFFVLWFYFCWRAVRKVDMLLNQVALLISKYRKWMRF